MSEQPKQYNFWQLVAQAISRPIEGIDLTLVQCSAYYAISLMFGAFFFVTAFILAIVSQMYILSTKQVFFGIKIGLSAWVFLLMLSVLAYLVKKIFITTNFRSNLMISGLASIVLMVQTILLLVFLVVFRDSLIATFVDGPFTFSLHVVGLLFVLLYGVLFILLVIQQSFSGSGINPSHSWYLAPLVFFGSVCIAGSVAKAIIFNY